MTATTPLIYSSGMVPGQLRLSQRALAALISLACLAVLCLAVYLVPSPEGVGTHTALGLQQCAFLARTGIPCPSCGMTTSFSWFVRGNLIASVYIQPMGAMLAFLSAMTVWAAGYSAISGRAVHRVVLSMPRRYHFVPLLALSLIAWAWKIYIHLHGIDGWPR